MRGNQVNAPSDNQTQFQAPREESFNFGMNPGNPYANPLLMMQQQQYMQAMQMQYSNMMNQANDFERGESQHQ